MKGTDKIPLISEESQIPDHALIMSKPQLLKTIK